MYFLKAGDLFWRENIKLKDSKRDYLQKEQTAN